MVEVQFGVGAAARAHRAASLPETTARRLSTTPACDNFDTCPFFKRRAAITGRLCDSAKPRVPGLPVKNFRLYDDPARSHARNAWLACPCSGCAPGKPGLYPSSQRTGLSSLPLPRSSVPSLEAAMLPTLAPLSPRAGPYFFPHIIVVLPKYWAAFRDACDFCMSGMSNRALRRAGPIGIVRSVAATPAVSSSLGACRMTPNPSHILLPWRKVHGRRRILLPRRLPYFPAPLPEWGLFLFRVGGPGLQTCEKCMAGMWPVRLRRAPNRAIYHSSLRRRLYLLPRPRVSRHWTAPYPPPSARSNRQIDVSSSLVFLPPL